MLEIAQWCKILFAPAQLCCWGRRLWLIARVPVTFPKIDSAPFTKSLRPDGTWQSLLPHCSQQCFLVGRWRHHPTMQIACRLQIDCGQPVPDAGFTLCYSDIAPWQTLPSHANSPPEACFRQKSWNASAEGIQPYSTVARMLISAPLMQMNASLAFFQLQWEDHGLEPDMWGSASIGYAVPTNRTPLGSNMKGSALPFGYVFQYIAPCNIIRFCSWILSQDRVHVLTAA